MSFAGPAGTPFIVHKPDFREIIRVYKVQEVSVYHFISFISHKLEKGIIDLQDPSVPEKNYPDRGISEQDIFILQTLKN